MTDKEKIKAEIERRKKEAYGTEWGWAVQCATYDEILSFINSLPEDPISENVLNMLTRDYNIQYADVESGIHAYAEDYSFNIESELFNQLTKEQQVLWRKEIEQAVINGGHCGVELARDKRYEENREPVSEDLKRASIDAAFEDMCNRQIMEDSEEKRSLYSRIFRRGFKAGAQWQKEKIKRIVDKIDVNNHSFEDLEDLYDSLCEMIKNLKEE